MSSPSMIPGLLLEPISPDNPAGEDLRFTECYEKIREARREDDGLSTGKWEKQEPKTADWDLVSALAGDCLCRKSKDLQVAIWLTEASVKLHAFAGLRDSMALIRDLLVRYWDHGLYPQVEDGDLEFRAGILESLGGERITGFVRTLPVTARPDGDNYPYYRFDEARRTSAEADSKKRQAMLAEGRITMEMFEAAVRATPAEKFQVIREDFEQAYRAYRDLNTVCTEKFGPQAPGFSELRSVLQECDDVVSRIARMKAGEQAAEQPMAAAAAAGAGGTMTFPAATLAEAGPPGSTSWTHAEELIRTGRIDQGLAEMAQLAATETSGRARFLRKLLLAEACLARNRPRLARVVLEELREQIDRYHLDEWEASELIARVWTNLYHSYKKSSEEDRAGQLYERLCRLDPWQALQCGQE